MTLSEIICDGIKNGRWLLKSEESMVFVEVYLVQLGNG